MVGEFPSTSLLTHIGLFGLLCAEMDNSDQSDTKNFLSFIIFVFIFFSVFYSGVIRLAFFSRSLVCFVVRNTFSARFTLSVKVLLSSKFANSKFSIV